MISPKQWLTQNHNAELGYMEMVRECSEKTPCTMGAARSAVARFRKHSIEQYKESGVTKAKGTVSVSDVLNQHDPLTILRNKASSLTKNGLMENRIFQDYCKLPQTQYKRYSNEIEFDKYKARTGNIVYWGHPDDINTLKETGRFE